MKTELIVDEKTLSPIDRLGLAWCRLNRGEWDPILGKKPDYLDSLPAHKPWWRFWDKRPVRWQYEIKIMNAIERMIGGGNTSRCWWIFVLGRTEEEWFHWYIRRGLED